MKTRLYHFYLHIDAGGEIEVRKRFDDLLAGIQNLDEAFMDAKLELFARILVDERRPVHGVALDLGGRRIIKKKLGGIALRHFNNIAGGRID